MLISALLQLSGPTRMALEMQADKIIKNIFDSGPHSPVNILSKMYQQKWQNILKNGRTFYGQWGPQIWLIHIDSAMNNWNIFCLLYPNQTTRSHYIEEITLPPYADLSSCELMMLANYSEYKSANDSLIIDSLSTAM